MKNKIIWIIVILIFSGFSFENDECKKDLLKIYEHLEQENTDNSLCLFMEINNKVEYREGNENKAINEVQKIYHNKQRSFIDSENLTVVQDDKHMVAIYKLPKTIAIANKIDEQGQEVKMAQFDMIRNSVLNNGKISSCTAIGNEQTQIDFVFSNTDPDFGDIDVLSIIYNKAENKILEIITQYKEESQIKKSHLEFKKYEYIPASKMYSGAALDFVYAGNTLKEAYQSFEIIDLRKNTQK